MLFSPGGWGTPEFKTFTGEKKKNSKLGSVWGANTMCYKHPLDDIQSWLGKKNSRFSCHNS